MCAQFAYISSPRLLLLTEHKKREKKYLNNRDIEQSVVGGRTSAVELLRSNSKTDLFSEALPY